MADEKDDEERIQVGHGPSGTIPTPALKDQPSPQTTWGGPFCFDRGVCLQDRQSGRVEASLGNGGEKVLNMYMRSEQAWEGSWLA